LYSIQYFDSYNLIKKFVWCILLKANQIQNEQAPQWLGSCFLIGGSWVQLPSMPFFKTWFKLKAKKKKKREREEPVQPITRPSHRFLPSLTGFRWGNCMADPKVCSNRSIHRFPVRSAGSSRVSKLCNQISLWLTKQNKRDQNVDFTSYGTKI